jgi:hypothetical protein
VSGTYSLSVDEITRVIFKVCADPTGKEAEFSAGYSGKSEPSDLDPRLEVVPGPQEREGLMGQRKILNREYDRRSIQRQAQIGGPLASAQEERLPRMRMIQANWFLPVVGVCDHVCGGGQGAERGCLAAGQKKPRPIATRGRDPIDIRL